MPYSALPDRRISYDNDGTVVGAWTLTAGVLSYPAGSTLISWNGYSWTKLSIGSMPQGGGTMGAILFFPEQREVTAIYAWGDDVAYGGAATSITGVAGSNDTTNGLDGTWETASMTGGVPGYVNNYSWRDGIKPVSFTGGKRTIRVYKSSDLGYFRVLHLYGEKVAGQTPDDIIFIDHDTTPGVEYQAPEDFGDRPLGTTVTRQFRVKNTSATLTANAINLQCNDTDFAISTDNTTWVTTINIASLGPGAESSTMYVRNTTPAVGNLLGPRFARIVATVSSWT